MCDQRSKSECWTTLYKNRSETKILQTFLTGQNKARLHTVWTPGIYRAEVSQKDEV